MVDIVSSLKRFAVIIVILVAAAFSLVIAVDKLLSLQTHFTTLVHQTVETVIVVSFGLIIVFFVRLSKPLLSKHVGAYFATIFQFFMVLLLSVAIIFATLGIFQVSATTLLLGGGIATIVFGLVISTFVGNIMAGTLVLMTRPFRVGDTVVVNNIPGKVEEITAMVTRIRNDIGGLMVIPNTAIVQGGVIVTTFSHDTTLQRLPYQEGDKVYTTYMNETGIVKEMTPFQTKILLDSGKEITFMNSSVLTGNVAIAKINQK